MDKYIVILRGDGVADIYSTGLEKIAKSGSPTEQEQPIGEAPDPGKSGGEPQPTHPGAIDDEMVVVETIPVPPSDLGEGMVLYARKRAGEDFTDWASINIPNLGTPLELFEYQLPKIDRTFDSVWQVKDHLESGAFAGVVAVQGARPVFAINNPNLLNTLKEADQLVQAMPTSEFLLVLGKF